VNVASHIAAERKPVLLSNVRQQNHVFALPLA
jgi:hypothetical protein